MTAHRIRFEGPAALAVRVATALADATGVELTSSEQPSLLDGGVVRLDVVVDGSSDDVGTAVANVNDDLPGGASLRIVD